MRSGSLDAKISISNVDSMITYFWVVVFLYLLCKTEWQKRYKSLKGGLSNTRLNRPSCKPEGRTLSEFLSGID